MIKNGHKLVPSSSLIPESDPTTLFVSSGMQPLLRYFLGEKHPLGTRIVNSQICLRAHGFMDDLLEVGDNRHTSFFEMLGNWSFGDYFKKEQINFFYEFLTKELKLDPSKLYVSCFVGEDSLGIPQDIEAVNTWKEIFASEGIDCEVVSFSNMDEASNLGFRNSRITLYPGKKNWWSRNGSPEKMPDGDIGGPDTEVFYDFGFSHDEKFGKECHPNCDCGRFLEIGNSVFTQFQKVNGKFVELPSKNVDFGGGLERLVAVSNNTDDVFLTDLYKNIIREIEVNLQISYSDNKSLFRILADHMKSATFLLNFGVIPSNKLQGYILRKFLRRSAVKIYLLNQDINFTEVLTSLPGAVVETYQDVEDKFQIKIKEEQKKSQLENWKNIIINECESFKKILSNGMKIVNKTKDDEVSGRFVFDLYQNLGFPFEVSHDIFLNRGIQISHSEFLEEFQKHRTISR
jgi:alanyl-tRNA synthetase